MKTAKISRRRFLSGAALTATTFTVVPRHVLGGARHVPPSEKLDIASIGIGGMGSSDVGQVSTENIVALCDVDWRHAAGTFKRFPKAKKYRDFLAEYRRLQEERIAAFKEFAADVHEGRFPEAGHLLKMDEALLNEFVAEVGGES